MLCHAGAGAGATVPPAQQQLRLAASETCRAVVRSGVATEALGTQQGADDGANILSAVAYPDCPSLAHSGLSGRVTGSCLGQCDKQCQAARTHAVLPGDRQQCLAIGSCAALVECDSAAEVLRVPKPSLNCSGSPGLSYIHELSH